MLFCFSSFPISNTLDITANQQYVALQIEMLLMEIFLPFWITFKSNRDEYFVQMILKNNKIF
jgi:hypothetical protein